MEDIFLHKKTGGKYRLISGSAKIEADLSSVVVYQSVDNDQVWVRPITEWFDGRFVPVE